MEYMGLKGYDINTVFVNILEPFNPSGAINKSEGLMKMWKWFWKPFPVLFEIIWFGDPKVTSQKMV